MSPTRWATSLVLAFFLLLAGSSMQAQWVLAAHAAKNQINRMTQRSETGGYDVATVVLDADPSKVYDKTVELLKTHPDVTITKEDKQTGKIEIHKGRQVAGFQIYALSAKVTEMIVASGVGNAKEPDATPMVVEAILHVCKEFSVECTVQPH